MPNPISGNRPPLPRLLDAHALGASAAGTAARNAAGNGTARRTEPALLRRDINIRVRILNGAQANEQPPGELAGGAGGAVTVDPVSHPSREQQG